MIEVNQLTKMYGPRAAISDLTFKINKGEIVGFLGPNGAGKSTTMKILTGYMPATSGSVVINGFDLSDDDHEFKRHIGYLPEIPPVYRDMVVSDYLRYAGLIHGVEKSKIGARVETVIEQVHLGEVKNRIVGHLSKGFQQRVGLAQALVHDPEILILDEPTVGLDPKQIIDIRNLIKSLAGQHTVILSSHILPEVTATCERIIVVNKGKIVAQDSLQTLLSKIGEGSTYRLAVKNPNDSAIGKIQQISGVKDVQRVNGHFNIRLNEDNVDAREKIVETAVSEKMGVIEFSPQKMSLEEVFLELTTEESV